MYSWIEYVKQHDGAFPSYLELYGWGERPVLAFAAWLAAHDNDQYLTSDQVIAASEVNDGTSQAMISEIIAKIPILASEDTEDLYTRFLGDAARVGQHISSPKPVAPLGSVAELKIPERGEKESKIRSESRSEILLKFIGGSKSLWIETNSEIIGDLQEGKQLSCLQVDESVIFFDGSSDRIRLATKIKEICATAIKGRALIMLKKPFFGSPKLCVTGNIDISLVKKFVSPEISAKIVEVAPKVQATKMPPAKFSDSRMQKELPGKVNDQFKGWAVRAEKLPGASVEEVFSNLFDARLRMTLPKGYRGACATSTYVLKECLNGRPTKCNFNAETPAKGFGPSDREKRLGKPVLRGATEDEVKAFIAKAGHDLIFEIGGSSPEGDSGHAIIGVSPSTYLDAENGLGDSNLTWKTMRGLGHDVFTVWYAGRVHSSLKGSTRS
ncbi:hypothetical protein [Streptomyces vinaceus]|uniref:hypothetical protein n=1 Tax=Streptomyces vinaceus TaxID=1960 RepID=UPI00382B44DC